MTDKEAMNVASQCRATASADLCKNILVDGGSGFLFELLLDAAKAIETLAQEKALQTLHSENERLGLYRDAYAQPEQEPVAWGVFEGNLHDMFFTQEEAQEMASLKGSHAEVRPLYTTPPQRTWVGLKKEDYVLVNQLCINPIQAAEFVDRLLKGKNT